MSAFTIQASPSVLDVEGLTFGFLFLGQDQVGWIESENLVGIDEVATKQYLKGRTFGGKAEVRHPALTISAHGTPFDLLKDFRGCQCLSTECYKCRRWDRLRLFPKTFCHYCGHPVVRGLSIEFGCEFVPTFAFHRAYFDLRVY
jgi:hypothetical protein